MARLALRAPATAALAAAATIVSVAGATRRPQQLPGISFSSSILVSVKVILVPVSKSMERRECGRGSSARETSRTPGDEGGVEGSVDGGSRRFGLSLGLARMRTHLLAFLALGLFRTVRVRVHLIVRDLRFQNAAGNLHFLLLPLLRLHLLLLLLLRVLGAAVCGGGWRRRQFCRGGRISTRRRNTIAPQIARRNHIRCLLEQMHHR